MQTHMAKVCENQINYDKLGLGLRKAKDFYFKRPSEVMSLKQCLVTRCVRPCNLPPCVSGVG